MSSITDHAKVCAVITAIMGARASVGRNWGQWNGTNYVGFVAEVDDSVQRVRRIVSAATELAAACELLGDVRREHPDLVEAAPYSEAYVEGMGVYQAYLDAAIDASQAEVNARLADIRSHDRQLVAAVADAIGVTSLEEVAA